MASPARKLTLHQQAVLVQVLLAFPEQQVTVQYSPSGGDALAYARDFVTIFKAVGWKVEESGSAERARAAQAGGLALVLSPDRRWPPAAEALRDALRIYGIEVEILSDSGGGLAPGDFVFSVGRDGPRD